MHPAKTLLWYVPAAALPVLALLGTNYLAVGQLRPVQSEFASAWYQYPGSHWLGLHDPNRHGIDFASRVETRWQYAFHLTLGHHGIFSLTPLFLLAWWGMIQGSVKAPAGPANHGGKRNLPRLLFPATLVQSLVVIGFYLITTNNYGGNTCGPRWLMWLTPLWLVTMLPVLDRLSCCRWGRGLAVGLLVVSVLSASYPAWNPWRQPWIYRLLDSQGRIPY